ncbi:molecular chaperone [Enterobacteriaceae bacterium ESL0689]|nr:molecular chaperone [Enterobacteriaceae bacterium ESL0689]
MSVARYLLAVLGILSISAHGGIMPSRSRIIYSSDNKDASIMLVNTNDYPVVVQTWIDNGEGSPDIQDMPFVSIPPLFYLEPAAIKAVRVLYNKAALPQDKESLFWFNMYEIPPEHKELTADNSVLVTMNTQIKLFYRPHGLTMTSDQAIQKIVCSLYDKASVSCYNPTPVHISVTDVQLWLSEAASVKATNEEYLIKPFGKNLYHFKDAVAPLKMALQYIDDAGNTSEHVITLKK